MVAGRDGLSLGVLRPSFGRPHGGSAAAAGNDSGLQSFGRPSFDAGVSRTIPVSSEMAKAATPIARAANSVTGNAEGRASVPHSATGREPSPANPMPARHNSWTTGANLEPSRKAARATPASSTPAPLYGRVSAPVAHAGPGGGTASTI